MFIKYELACKEAGMKEEDIAKIRRMFDASYKRLKRRKLSQKKEGLSFISVSDMSGQDNEFDYELEDTQTDVEELACQSIMLSDLRKYMDELPEEDREFLYDYFEGYNDKNRRMAEKYGMSIRQVRYRKEKLLKKLRERFEKG